MDAEEKSTIVADGVLSGLVGGICVLAVFTLYDLLTTELFRTPSVLHAHFFEGPDAALSVGPDADRALVYTFFHFAVWIAAGFCAAYTAALRRIYPALWYAVVVGPFAILCVFFWVAGVWGVPGLGVHQFWVGAMLGGFAMAALIFWRNPVDADLLED